MQGPTLLGAILDRFMLELMSLGRVHTKSNLDVQVLVPPKTDSGGGGVADWIFKRTPAELRAEMVSAQKKREQREVQFWVFLV